MLFFVLVFAFVWGVFGLIKRLYDARAARLIKRASGAKEAVAIRKRLLKKRTVSLYVWLGILIGAVFVIYAVYHSVAGISRDMDIALSFWLNIIACTVLLYVQISYEKSKKDLFGNLSYFTTDEYLARNEEFYLYLRGFDDDVPFKESGKYVLKFDESLFAEAVEYGAGVPMCALGMTKEVDSPVGAQRIYVDDDNWQEKVLLLMQRAKQIFILINNSQSCLWEIEQAATMKDKILFIVDSRERYDYVRERYGDMFGMPEPSAESSDGFFFRCGSEATCFDSTINGYLSILNLTLDEVEAKQLESRKRAQRERNKKFAVGLLFTYVAVVVAVYVLTILFI